MPYARKSYKSKRMVKKPSYKRSYKKRSYSLRPSFGNIIGKRVLARHTLRTITSLNPGAGAIATLNCAANHTLDDPTLTISASQLRGYDQMKALYDKGTIIGSRMIVTFTTNPGATVTPRVGVLMYNLNSAPTTIGDHIDGLGNKTVTLPVGDTSGNRVLSLSYSPRKVLGHKQELDINPGSGTESYNFRCYAYPADNSADVASMTVEIKLEYLVVWTAPRTIPTSD